ncbi:MAG: 30S ribosomal protein S12 methylthiotransferase RimO [Blastochloris sp.]|nr:30S ribosomal protein S12 methylthiotransferase RimO [Blastochloris sp.]
MNAPLTHPPSSIAPIRVGMISLGCAKNLVDAEIMLGSMLREGIEITNDATTADVVIVNTCSFIDSAQEESVNTILESSQLRDQVRPGQGLVVSGCLPQRFRDDLPKLFPEVDAFIGIDQVANITAAVHNAIEKRRQRLLILPKKGPKTKARKVSAKLSQLDAGRQANDHEKTESLRGSETFGNTKQVLLAPVKDVPLVDVTQRPLFIPDFATPRFRLTPKHFAYLKIAEGCNHPCSFCIIPRMRGTHRSRQQNDILQEARNLIAEGVKEINLISQDSTYYGLDLRANHSRAISSPEKFNAAAKALPTDATTLCTLLRELNALPGDFWIRLLYTHPAHWTDELIQTIAECPKVARYIDIPLQHIHENMLERMRRETTRSYIEELLAKIRHGIPGITIRTTFIVGFPGERDEYFQSLLDFIKDTRFERLGVFTYSHEEGTRAAAMGSQLTDKIKKHRREQAMAAQHIVAQNVAQNFVGKTLRVLVEGQASARELKKANISSWEHGLIRETDSGAAKLKGNYLLARGEADAPDIDGRVYIRGQLPIGEFAHVKIVGHTDYDLIAEPV